MSKMISLTKRVGNIKKGSDGNSGYENTTNEKKFAIGNINKQLDQAKERICGLKGKSFEMI